MSAANDWAARLANQGVPAEAIEAAMETGAEHSRLGEGVAEDATAPAGPEGFAALLRQEAARHQAAPRRAPPPTTEPGIEATAAAFAAGQVSARELTGQHLEKLGELEALNAIARLEPEAAMAMADDRDAARAQGHALGPLAGVPMAHKDLYARAGWRLEAGSKVLAGNVAPQTAHAIARLDLAGQVDCGRLNTVEFALGPDGRNVHTGSVRNPWNPDHVPGGSSSGSGAAVAAGMLPAALGSDTGGSIRLPAAACGLVGLKPTAGVVGRSGVFPLSGSLDTVGPLTRTVRDAALLTELMAGPDPEDPQSLSLPMLDLMGGIEDGLRGLRIGVAEAYFLDPVAPEIAAALDAARQTLEGEGAALTKIVLPGIELANALNVIITNVEAATQHRPWLRTRAGDYGPGTVARLISGLFVSGTAYLAALGRRATLLRALLDGPLAEVDAVLAPVWRFELPRIGDGSGDGSGVVHTGHCTRPANFLGLPAVTVPCALSRAGLPIGLQLIGRPFSEAVLLRAARGYERARCFWAEHRPTLHV